MLLQRLLCTALFVFSSCLFQQSLSLTLLFQEVWPLGASQCAVLWLLHAQLHRFGLGVLQMTAALPGVRYIQCITLVRLSGTAITLVRVSGTAITASRAASLCFDAAQSAAGTGCVTCIWVQSQLTSCHVACCEACSENFPVGRSPAGKFML